jgi:hypothetical protein
MDLITLREWNVISDFFRDEAREARKAARKAR